MRRRSLFWLLLPSHIVLGLVGSALVFLVIFNSIRDVVYKEKERHLKRLASVISEQALPLFVNRDYERLVQLATTMEAHTGFRITFFNVDPAVVADSLNRSQANDFDALVRSLPLLPNAPKINSGYVHNGSQERMFLSLRLGPDALPNGYLRIAAPTSSLQSLARSLLWKGVPIGFLVCLLAWFVSSYIARRLSLPLEQLRQAAIAFADGKFDMKLRATQAYEFGALARAMNSMGTQLKEKIHTVVQQKNELDAVLSSMIDGVIAIDLQERIINVNQAAVDLAGLPNQEIKGHYIEEVIRSTGLIDFIRRILVSREPMEEELTVHRRKDLFLRMYGRALTDGDGTTIGALIVLNDETQIRKLEQVRRDFVANVSHELKTPITSIKGFVETLLDGAMDNRSDLERFLKIVSNQSDRLNAIIEDLLSLSRIEHLGEEIERSESDMLKVMQTAVQFSELKAKEKHVSLKVSCEENLIASVNPPLLEQAIVNLVDNAIKYSPPESSVLISASTDHDYLVIKVTDSGRGIDKEHLPRLFERFYRVDKARSRAMGGTGLGLALVKHIAQAHRGYATVESSPGQGSTFSLYVAKD